MHRIAWPLSARDLRKDMIAQALWESSPDVGSSKKSRRRGYASYMRMLRIYDGAIY